jgi:ABC-2 type transport system ATP-binding protein
LGRPDRVFLTPDLQRRDTAVGDLNVPLPLTCEVIGHHGWLRGGIADGAHDESATLSGVGVRTSKMATADCAAPRTTLMWIHCVGGNPPAQGDTESWRQRVLEQASPLTAGQARPLGPAIAARGLGKRFGDRVAFSDVSFEIGYGEVFGFLGPNGAGKTTTVRTLGTLLAPTSGSATVAGFPLTPENAVEIRRRIAIMPEAPGLYLKLTVIENLECFADLYEISEANDRVAAALQAVNLSDRGRDTCGTLSKGLRQRVALARALLSDPEVLFLDEPTAGLDPVASREVHELIDGLRKRGVTIFLTTHRLEEAERLCDRVAILNTTLRTIGRPDELRDQLFARTITVRTLRPLADPGQVFTGLTAVDSWRADGTTGSYVLAVSDPSVAAPAATRALVAAGADVLSIAESHHSLEDVYLELIAEDPEASRSEA